MNEKHQMTSNKFQISPNDPIKNTAKLIKKVEFSLVVLALVFGAYWGFGICDLEFSPQEAGTSNHKIAMDDVR